MRNSRVGDLLVASTAVEGTILDQSVCLLVYEDEASAIGLMLNRPLVTLSTGSAQAGSTAPNPAAPNPATPHPSASSSQAETRSPNRVFEIHPESTGPDPLVAEGIVWSGDTGPGGGPTKQVVALVGPPGDPDASKLLSGKSLHFGGPLSGPIVAIHGAAELAEAEAGEGIFVAAQRDNLEALLRSPQRGPYRLIVGHLGWTQEQLNNEIEAGVWHRMPANAGIISTEDALLWPKLIGTATAHSLSRWLGVSHVAEAHRLN